MEQNPERWAKDDDKASLCGVWSLVFNFLNENETETVAGTNEPAEEKTSALKPNSAFMNKSYSLLESSSLGKTKSIVKPNLLTVSLCRRKIERAAREALLGPCRKKIEKFTAMIMRT